MAISVRTSRQHKKHLRRLAWFHYRNAPLDISNRELNFLGRILHGTWPKDDWARLWWCQWARRQQPTEEW